jgi:hypothetical protein
LGKRFTFWLAVGGVSLLTQFGIELLADKTSSAGLKSFVNYVHRGAA